MEIGLGLHWEGGRAVGPLQGAIALGTDPRGTSQSFAQGAGTGCGVLPLTVIWAVASIMPREEMATQV